MSGPGDALVLALAEGFDQLLPGQIDGQSQWRSAGFGTWSVASGNGGQILTQAQGASNSFHLNQVAYGAATFADQRALVDFRFAEGANAPQLWVRKTAVTGDGGGYVVVHVPGNSRQWILGRHQAGTGASVEQLAAIQGGQGPQLAEGVWYTLELAAIDNDKGEPVLEVYLYAIGEPRPASPLIRHTDKRKTFAAGYVALGGETTAAYDNFRLYAPPGHLPPTPTALPSPTPAAPTGTATAVEATPKSAPPSTATTGPATPTSASEAAPIGLYRAINLNGDPTIIDGLAWEGKSAPNYSAVAGSFCDQSVPLIPPTDAGRAAMIRCSVWGNAAQLSITEVPAGAYQIYLYVWEDNRSENFSVKLQGQLVQRDYITGPAGTWSRLGPWSVTLTSAGAIQLSTGGGSANLSGIEIWRIK